MTRVFQYLCSAGLFWTCALHIPWAMADEPATKSPKFTTPDAGQKAPAATSSGLTNPVIAVIDLRQVFEQARERQQRLQNLNEKNKEPTPERKKLEAELQELEISLHDFALFPRGEVDLGLSLSPGIRRTEVSFEEVLERVAASDLPDATRLLKKYRLKQHELAGLREAELLEKKAQRAALDRKLLLRIRVIVRKIVDANNITHVFNKTDALDKLDGLQATIDSPIVYTRPEYDITSLVVAGLNHEIDIEPIKDSAKRRLEPGTRPGPAVYIPVK